MNWTLFLILLIPNWLRQFVYFLRQKKDRKLSYVDSLETRWFMKRRYYFIGYVEEVIFALIYTYFFSLGLKFFAYGWIFDAFQDIFIAIFGNFYLKYFKNFYERFIVREIILPYSLVGPLLQLLSNFL